MPSDALLDPWQPCAPAAITGSTAALSPLSSSSHKIASVSGYRAPPTRPIPVRFDRRKSSRARSPPLLSPPDSVGSTASSSSSSLDGPHTPSDASDLLLRLSGTRKNSLFEDDEDEIEPRWPTMPAGTSMTRPLECRACAQAEHAAAVMRRPSIPSLVLQPGEDPLRSVSDAFEVDVWPCRPDVPEPDPPPPHLLKRRTSSFAGALLAFTRLAVPTTGEPSRSSKSLLTAALQAGAASTPLSPAASFLTESSPRPPSRPTPPSSPPKSVSVPPSPPRSMSDSRDERPSGIVQLQTFSSRRVAAVREPSTRTVSNDRHLHMLVAELAMIRARKIRTPLRPRSVVQREGTPLVWRCMSSAPGRSATHSDAPRRSTLRNEIVV